MMQVATLQKLLITIRECFNCDDETECLSFKDYFDIGANHFSSNLAPDVNRIYGTIKFNFSSQLGFIGILMKNILMNLTKTYYAKILQLRFKHTTQLNQMIRMMIQNTEKM